MASIFDRNGRYYIAFHSANESPTQKQLSLFTTDQREAQRRKLDLEEAYEENRFDPWSQTVQDFLGATDPDTEDITCEDALNRFLSVKNRQDCTDGTIASYRRVLSCFFKDQNLTERPLSSLRTSHAEKFIRQDHLAAATKGKRYRILRAFCNYFVSQGSLQESPIDSIKAPRNGRKLPKALTRDEFKTLTDAANKWFGRLLKFAVFSGMRPAELGRLRWSDVDFDRDLIRIDRQKNRTESTIALTGAAREVLEEMLIEAAQADVYESERQGMEDTAASDQRIFNRDGRDGDSWVQHISRRFLNLRRECGIRDEVTMYSCRHAHATWLADQGVPLHHIKEQMRHADIGTTQKYLHVSNRRLKESLSGVF